MELKCSLCARSEISSARADWVRVAAAINQQPEHKTTARVRRVIPIHVILHGHGHDTRHLSSADVYDARSEDDLVHRVLEFKMHAAAQILAHDHQTPPC